MSDGFTIIFGDEGAGKTALATYFLKEKYMHEGKRILKESCALIDYANKKFGRNLSFPDKVPFYTNYPIKLHVGYRKYYEPYYLNGYYFGVANKEMDTEYVAPGSTFILDESQRIYDSRQSSSFPDWVSYAFELRRQARLTIYLLAQRANLIDRNIKEVGVRVIEVVGLKNVKDAAGNVVKTTWYCREFENWTAAEKYLKNGEQTYTETVYVNEGNNIFECFDSYARLEELLPPEGYDFDYLPHKKPEGITKRQEKFYMPGEPKEFRRSKKEKNAA